MRTLLGALALVLATPVSAGAAGPAEHARAHRPDLRVHRVVTGLDHPWDTKFLPGGTMLITERDRARLSAYDHGVRTTVRFPSRRIWVSGETGLMSMEVDPRFTSNRRIYTCSGWVTRSGGHDVRVNAWHLNRALTRARHVETLVHGFPTSSGRHGGCRLLITRNGSLLVGTGDAAETPNPQSLHSLGGKTLRLDRMTGRPWPGNPWRHATNHNKRYIQTYGHRNVQGLAERKDGTLWNIEQGTYRDDEVNKLTNGGNYGWQPGPGYDESPPMTNHALPGRQIDARWSSGDPTLATSGGTFVYGRTWGRYAGALAVCALKASRVVLLKLDASGHLTWQRAPQALRSYGRIRSATLGPHHHLFLTTDNGGGNDVVLRVSPR